ncbi:MAG: glycoside hydrolase family 3 protein [Verrucomicrobia bacterium]|nr:glycoside hydrolase family 3 protein [Verrucomicrobiota bacterium]
MPALVGRFRRAKPAGVPYAKEMSAHPAGRLIVMGVPGPELNDGLRDLIRRIRPGGFIYFTRNMSHAGQFHALVRECRDLAGHPSIFTVDQEGGRVSRLAVMGERPPSGEDLAQAGREEWFSEHGRLTGRLMQAVGLNLNLAPVLDYAPPERKGVDNSLAGRCYGKHPREIIPRARAYLRGMRSEGVAGTGKHFPGYTFCGLDPHGDLPLVDRPKEKVEAEELSVFREVGKECEAMMIGHAQFPAWGVNSGPASLNRAIVTGLLKDTMGYRGLVMTDDLEMGAIANRYGSAEASRQAVRAGEEILLVCHNPACAEIARDALAEMPEQAWRPAVEKVAAFCAGLKEPAEKFEEGNWQQINREIGEFRKKVTGRG